MIRSIYLLAFLSLLVTTNVLSQTLDIPFETGDIVEQFQHYDSEKEKLINGSAKGLKGTKWKVIEIAENYIRLELVKGLYKPWWDPDVVYKPGEYSDEHFTSEAYLEKFPNAGNIEQIIRTYRKIDSAQ